MGLLRVTVEDQHIQINQVLAWSRSLVQLTINLLVHVFIHTLDLYFFQHRIHMFVCVFTFDLNSVKMDVLNAKVK